MFEREGYLDARVADIALEARVAHGTFYNYFESRFHVFCVLAHSIVEEIRAELTSRELGDHVDPLAELTSGFVVVGKFYERNSRIFAVLEQFASIDSASAAVRLTVRAPLVEWVTTAVELLQSDGEADDRLCPVATASAIVSSFDRSLYEWHVLDVPRHPTNTLESLVDVLCRSALQPAGSQRGGFMRD